MEIDCGDGVCRSCRDAILFNLQYPNTCRKFKKCDGKCETDHRQKNTSENYVFQVALAPDLLKKDAKVARTISGPATDTFEQLEQAIHIAFNWTTHCEDSRFVVSKPGFSIDDFDFTGDDRKVIFEIVRDGALCGRRNKCLNTELQKAFSSSECNNFDMWYLYGDQEQWHHQIRITGREKAAKNWRCLDGEGHRVAENCGGFYNWIEIVEAYRTNTPNTDQQRWRDWYETRGAGAAPKGLANGNIREWDMEQVNRLLAQLPLSYPFGTDL